MSRFEDAFTDLMISKINPDPMAQLMPMMAQQFLASGEVATDRSKIGVMQELRAIIKECQSETEDPKVTAAFQSMLDKYVS
jgi:hypothetical protein